MAEIQTGLPEAMRAALEARIQGGKLELPILPGVASLVLAEGFDADSDVRRLSDLIHRDQAIAGHLLRVATAETFRARLTGLDLSGFTDLVAGGAIIETGDLVSAEELLGQIGTVPGLAKVLDRLGLGDAPSGGQAASGIEFVLEGLHLTRRLAKELTDDGRTLYGS